MVHISKHIRQRILLINEPEPEKPSTLSTFSMPNGRLFQLEIVAGKKRVPNISITICLEVFEFEAVILPCTGVGWREDVLRFNQCESVNNFVKKN